MKKTVLTIIAILLVFSIMGGCASTAPSQSGTGTTETSTATASGASEEGKFYPGTTVLTMSTWIGYAPLHLAVEMGFFEEEGVDVKISVIESAGDQRSALASGQVQGSASTLDTIVMSQSIGIDVTQVLALDYSNGGDGVVSLKEYNSLADLKGKNVAIDTTGGASLFWFNYMLKDQGLTMDDFNITNMGAGDAGTAFVAGQVDAAVTWEPWLTNAQNTDFGKVLYSSADYPGVIVDTVCLSKDYVENYPDSVKGIANGWYKALAYIQSNPDESYKIMADAMGQSVEDFLAVLPAVKFYDQTENVDYFDNQISDMCQKVSDIWIELGLMSTPVAPEDSYNGSFVK